MVHCSFIICLALDSNLTCKFSLQFLLAIFTCKFYLQILLANLLANFCFSRFWKKIQKFWKYLIFWNFMIFFFFSFFSFFRKFKPRKFLRLVFVKLRFTCFLKGAGWFHVTMPIQRESILKKKVSKIYFLRERTK